MTLLSTVICRQLVARFSKVRSMYTPGIIYDQIISPFTKILLQLFWQYSSVQSQREWDRELETHLFSNWVTACFARVHEICIIVYFISPVHMQCCRSLPYNQTSSDSVVIWFKEDSFLQTVIVNSGISSRAVVELLVMKNLPAETETTDRTCVLFRCSCNWSGWLTQIFHSYQ